MAKLSPMMEQYFQIKQNYPETLLFFRLGDFYEMYGEDARIVAQKLDLTLTQRMVQGVGKVEMCGVPSAELDRYIEKLRHDFPITVYAGTGNDRNLYSLPKLKAEKAPVEVAAQYTITQNDIAMEWQSGE